MTIEQPKFESDPEGLRKKEQPNVIEGPWEKQMPETEIDTAEPAGQQSSPETSKDNVVIGPWPGSGLETEAVPELEPPQEPTEEPTEPVTPEVQPIPPESETERAEKLETARGKLNEIPDNPEKVAPETKPKEPQGPEGEDQKVRFPFSEQHTEYKSQICQKCQGKGRFLFIFKCPICKGLGKISIPDRTTSKSGYYEVDRKGNLSEKVK